MEDKNSGGAACNNPRTGFRDEGGMPEFFSAIKVKMTRSTRSNPTTNAPQREICLQCRWHCSCSLQRLNLRAPRMQLLASGASYT
ncbi:hypothetical protein L915_12651, partial [Phytophthora nicotianae]